MSDPTEGSAKRGREVFLDHFEQTVCCEQWAELIRRETKPDR